MCVMNKKSSKNLISRHKTRMTLLQILDRANKKGRSLRFKNDEDALSRCS